MIFEHFALNVPQPLEMVKWYTEHLKLKVVFKQEVSPFMTFLADESGRVVIELYRNDISPILDFKNMHHLEFHVAFISKDAKMDSDYLISKGASLVEEIIPSAKTHLVMLRDPWGVPLQICQREHLLDTD